MTFLNNSLQIKFASCEDALGSYPRFCYLEPIRVKPEKAVIRLPLAPPVQPITSIPAIVLCNTVTGMATVRALAECGIDVHAFLFSDDDLLYHSRYATKVACNALHDDEEGLVRFLIEYADRIGGRPVVIPTGDAHALLLAKYRDELAPHCRTWQLSHGELGRLVNKTRLYEAAARAGVRTIPSLSSPTLEEVLEWSRHNPGPYLLKPSYEGISTCKLRRKNLVAESREQLLSYIEAHGSDSLVVQRRLRGGDGNIFDCYGLCDADGRVVCLTSHHRIRQYPPDLGATSMGEIPAPLPQQTEEYLFAATERLLATARYHGIFGIEWLRDEATGEFYPIDFNARPFLTIGHLRDCGVDLVVLAYMELTGQSLAGVDPRPVVTRKRWVLLNSDLDTFQILHSQERLSLLRWLGSLAGCESFAYCSWSDPMPGVISVLRIVARVARYMFGAKGPAAATPSTTSAAVRGIYR